jgi:Skp family chaperone for outer membrane proteins
MKSVFKICALGILLLSAGFANAQAPKFGHIDLQGLIQVMPISSFTLFESDTISFL